MLYINLLLTCLIQPCLSFVSQEATSTVTATVWKTRVLEQSFDKSQLEKECFLLNVVQTQGPEMLWVSVGCDPGQKAVSVFNLQAVSVWAIAVCLPRTPYLLFYAYLRGVLLLGWACMSSECLQMSTHLTDIIIYCAALCLKYTNLMRHCWC